MEMKTTLLYLIIIGLMLGIGSCEQNESSVSVVPDKSDPSQEPEFTIPEKVAPNILQVQLGRIIINDEDIADDTRYTIRIFDSPNSYIPLGTSINIYKQNVSNISNIKLVNVFSGEKELYIQLTINGIEHRRIKKNVYSIESLVELGDIIFNLYSISVAVNLEYTGISIDKIKEANIVISGSSDLFGGFKSYSHIIGVDGGKAIQYNISTLTPENANAVPMEFNTKVIINLENKQSFSSKTTKTLLNNYTVNLDLGIVRFDLIKLEGTLGDVKVNEVPVENHKIIGTILFPEYMHGFSSLSSNNIWETYLESRSDFIEGKIFINICNYDGSITKYYSVYKYIFTEILNIGNNDISNIHLGNILIIANKTINGIVKSGNSYLNKFTIAALSESVDSLNFPNINKNIIFDVSISETNGNWEAIVQDTVPEYVWYIVVVRKENTPNYGYFITTSAVPLNDSILDIQNMVELHY